MGQKVRGFEGQWFRGTAGSSAATQILNVVDANYNVDLEEMDTTVRGDGSTVPTKTGTVTAKAVSALDLTMRQDVSDTNYVALETAARTGGIIAIKCKSYSSGKGYDGDVYVKMDEPQPLAGDKVVKFTFMVTDDGGRAPSLNAS